jgi:hypothetical protein
MEPNRVRKAPQGRDVENARGEHTYARVPDCLWRLPASERTAAVEVWAALHHYCRIDPIPRRITDDRLSECPCLADRSTEHVGKGLGILCRLGLIARTARGSRREVAITARLKGPKKQGAPKPDAPAANPPKRVGVQIPTYHSPDSGNMVDGWSPMAFWLSVRENRQSGS